MISKCPIATEVRTQGLGSVTLVGRRCHHHEWNMYSQAWVFESGLGKGTLLIWLSQNHIPQFTQWSGGSEGGVPGKG